jgi:hypothetical protein
MADGSSTTRPLPLTQTSVLTVPRSIATPERSLITSTYCSIFLLFLNRHLPT